MQFVSMMIIAAVTTVSAIKTQGRSKIQNSVVPMGASASPAKPKSKANFFTKMNCMTTSRLSKNNKVQPVKLLLTFDDFELAQQTYGEALKVMMTANNVNEEQVNEMKENMYKTCDAHDFVSGSPDMEPIPVIAHIPEKVLYKAIVNSNANFLKFLELKGFVVSNTTLSEAIVEMYEKNETEGLQAFMDGELDAGETLNMLFKELVSSPQFIKILMDGLNTDDISLVTKKDAHDAFCRVVRC